MKHPTFLIAAHDIRLAWKNSSFLVMLAFFLLLSGVSTILGSLQVHQQMNLYQDSVALLSSMGKTHLPSPPSLNPLSVSKDFVNYTSMIGALMAILIGWNGISSMKERKALILSRPVYRDSLVAGTYLGTAALLFIITLASMILVTALTLFTTNGALSTGEFSRLAVYFFGVWLYLLIFAALAQLVTVSMKEKHAALLITIIIWLVFSFLLPQIGDTMDLDNQIPGGFFSYLGLDKGQEQTLLSHFSWYEYVRDAIEELSVTKHFERFSYALLNVKPGFADTTTGMVIAAKALNFIVLLFTPVILTITSIIIYLRKEMKTNS